MQFYAAGKVWQRATQHRAAIYTAASRHHGFCDGAQ